MPDFTFGFVLAQCMGFIMKICPVCSAQVADKEAVCPDCGYVFSKPEPKAPQPPQAPQAPQAVQPNPNQYTQPPQPESFQQPAQPDASGRVLPTVEQLRGSAPAYNPYAQDPPSGNTAVGQLIWAILNALPILSMTPLPSAILGIIAIVYSVQAGKAVTGTEEKKKKKTAMTLNIIATSLYVLAIIAIIVIAVLIALFGDSGDFVGPGTKV